MTPDQLRQSLAELKGQRSLTIAFTGMGESTSRLTIDNAMLVPDEPDHLVKVTDGQSIFVIDAERVAYFRLGQRTSVHA